MEKLNLKRLDETHVTVSSKDYAIEDHITGQTFITNKQYMNKLFDQMGYRNLNVINILEEFAGKYISDIGTLRDASLYVNDITSSFIVASDKAVKAFCEFLEELDLRGFKIIKKMFPDTYNYWDQYEIESPSGVHFVIYLNLKDEYLQVLSIHFNDQRLLDGLLNEGEFYLTEDNFINNIFITLESKITPEVGYTPEQDLSYEEYVQALIILGYVKKGRRTYYLTDEGEQMQNIIGDLESILADYNVFSWLQRRINKSGYKFEDAFLLFSQNLDRLSYWTLKDFYLLNVDEKSDMFALNN